MLTLRRDAQIQTILDREHAIAKAHMEAGRKDRAVVALRRRKYQESMLVKTDQQLENLEQLVSGFPYTRFIQSSSVHTAYIRCLQSNSPSSKFLFFMD